MNAEPVPVREFVVVSYARTGSTQLVEYINQFPKTKCFWEVLKSESVSEIGWKYLLPYFSSSAAAEALHSKSALQFWLELRNSAYVENDRVGAKMFYYHRPGEDIWDHLLSNEIGVIHLTRSSLFESFVSLQLARQSGIWSLQSSSRSKRLVPRPKSETPKIQFDVAQYVKYRDYIVRQHGIVSTRLASNPRVLNVDYDQISDTAFMGRVLSEFFGLNSTVRQTLLKQSSNDPLRHIINKRDAFPFADDRLPMSIDDQSSQRNGR